MESLKLWENGTPYYKYGGDFDDDYHWCNFTLDGFCMSDGTPKPSWFELGQVLFAAYCTFDGENVTIKNTNDFLTLSYLTASYDITADGKTVKEGAIEIPDLKPHESFVAKAPAAVVDAERQKLERFRATRESLLAELQKLG